MFFIEGALRATVLGEKGYKPNHDYIFSFWVPRISYLMCSLLWGLTWGAQTILGLKYAHLGTEMNLLWILAVHYLIKILSEIHSRKIFNSILFNSNSWIRSSELVSGKKRRSYELYSTLRLFEHAGNMQKRKQRWIRHEVNFSTPGKIQRFPNLRCKSFHSTIVYWHPVGIKYHVLQQLFSNLYLSTPKVCLAYNDVWWYM